MTEYHVATDHLDPDTGEVTTTYLGTCTQVHADEVRAIAALPDTERWVKDHPRQAGSFAVLRDDGDLDMYVPTDAPEFRIYAPDPAPKGMREGSAEWKCPQEGCDWTHSAEIVDGAIRAEGYNAAYAEHMQTHGKSVNLPRGTTGPAYISGAVRFGSQAIGGAMDHPESGPRFTWHTTESPAGAAYFSSVALYLMRVASEPQVIYDPVSDKIGQFGPLNQSGRALKNDGARRTNREGKVNIQVEVLGKAANPWTKDFDPASKPNFQKLLAAGRDYGIPDDWPAGRPPAYPTGKSARSRAIWQSKPGHYAHAQVPGNDHEDPGAIDTTIVPGKASTDTGSDTGSTPSASTYTVKKGDTLSSIAKAHGTTVAKLVSLNNLRDADKLSVGQKLKLPATKPTAPQYEPFPGAEFFHGGRHSPIITAMGRRLVAEGCGRYNSGPGPDWTNADRESYRAWQKKLGYSGDDADGIPGKTSWDKLHVPNA